MLLLTRNLFETAHSTATEVQIQTKMAEVSDEEIIRRILGGEAVLYKELVRRCNRRLFRVCRAILGNNPEARDAVQHAYAQVYERLTQFEGRAKFPTWLTTIAIHEASLRRRQRSRIRPLGELHRENGRADSALSPEEQFSLAETRQILESMIDALPEKYCVVQIMRDVEGMSVAEAAQGLGISQDAAMVRLHRARALLRKRLYELFGSKVSDVFRFHLSPCDRVVHGVAERTRHRFNVTVPMKADVLSIELSSRRLRNPLIPKRLRTGGNLQGHFSLTFL